MAKKQLFVGDGNKVRPWAGAGRHMCQRGLHNLNRKRLGREGAGLGQLSEQHDLPAQTPKNSKFWPSNCYEGIFVKVGD